MKRLLVCIALELSLGTALVVPTFSDDSKSTPILAPIQVKGEDATHIKDSYNSLVVANKDLQIAILNAQVNAGVPKGWDFDLATFSFRPPAPATPTPTVPASKESKP